MDKRFFLLSILTTMIVSISFLGCDHKDKTNESMTVDSKIPESSPSAEEPSLASESVSPPDEQEESKLKTIAAGNKVVITGQLVKKDGSPITYGSVEIYEIKGNAYSIKFGEDGVLLNPTCKVNDEGRFTLELDLDVLEGKEGFLIQARLGSFDTGRSPLQNSNGDLIVLEFSEGAKNTDLGKIVVE